VIDDMDCILARVGNLGRVMKTTRDAIYQPILMLKMR
jgi:hypothetical protein